MNIMNELFGDDEQYKKRMKETREEIEKERKENPELAKYFYESDSKNVNSVDFLYEE